jgi:hypothetical protein
MSFLSGLGKGLSRAFDGTNLAITQAILAGDYQGAAALRARQGELQRQLQQDSEQHDARDRQVIGAKNMGIGDDAIGAMSPQDLSWVARQRAAFGLTDPTGGADGGEGADEGAAPPHYAAPQPLMPADQDTPGSLGGAFDHKGVNYLVGRAPGKLAQAWFRQGAPPGFGGAMDGATGTFPRANTPGHAAALPKGASFIAPDGSIRRKI